MCRSCGRKQRVDQWNKLSDAEYLFRMARQRAKKKNREFSITVEDVEAVDTDMCPILHIPIKRHPMVANTKSQRAQPQDAKSLDRIDSTKGYTPDNIRIVSWRSNSLLKDITIDELKLISDYYHQLSNGNQIQNSIGTS